MSGDTASPPQTDYTAQAQAQGAANVETAKIQGLLNNPNVITPYGNQTVSFGSGQPVFDQSGYDTAMGKYNTALNAFNATGGVQQGYSSEGPIGSTALSSPVMPTRDQFTTTPAIGQPTVTQTLTPQSQQIFDTQQGVRQGLANLASTGTGIASDVLNKPFSFGGNVQQSLDTSGIAKMPVNAGTTGYNAMMPRLNDQLDRQTAQTQNQLRNQGLVAGDEAYDNAMKDMNYSQNDARNQAIVSGLNLDMGANQQGFNQALQSGTFGNTAQQQGLTQALQQRDLPLNEISALMSGSQVQNPQFQGYSGATLQPAPIMQAAGLQGQQANNIFNQQTASNNSNTSGMYSLGAAALTAMAMY